MSIFKKSICILLIMLLMLWWPISTFATEIIESKAGLTKNLILKKLALKKINSGESYASSLDNFIDKIADNEKKLLKLEKKIESVQNKIKTSNSSKNINTSIIVNYLDAKVQLALWKINETKFALTDIERAKVNSEIMKLQKLVSKDLKANITTFISKYQTWKDYQEKWNSTLQLMFNQESFWKIDWNFALKDYTLNQSIFDSHLLGQIEADYNTSLNWYEDMNFEIHSFIDFIKKDGDLYLLLKDLSLIWGENIWVFEIYTQLLQKLSDENKYIKIANPDQKEALEMLKNFKPATIINDVDEFFWKALFEAYQKDWDNYIIIPTKHACEQVKKIGWKFDPFSFEECSDWQYENMVDKVNKNWKFYITFWNNNTLGFTLKKLIDPIHFSITYNEKEIKSALLSIIESATEYKEKEYLLVKYSQTKGTTFKLDLRNFDWNMLIGNKKISGNYSAYEWKQKIFTALLKGSYSKDTLNINTDFEVINPTSDIWDNSYWEVAPELLKGILNIKLNTKYNQNNADIVLEVWDNNNELLKIEFINSAKRVLKNIDIQIPTQFTTIEEIIFNKNTYIDEGETKIIEVENLELTIYDDKRCNDCSTDEILIQIQQIPGFENMKIIRKDYSDNGVNQYMTDNNITVLPAFIFNKFTSDKSINDYLIPLPSEEYSLQLGSTFDPFIERSDRWFFVLEKNILEKIKKDSYIKGNINAEITWLEYSDIECPFCAKLHNDGTPQTVSEQYGDKLNIIIHHFPLSFHANAQIWAEIIECVWEQKGSEAFYSIIDTAFTEKNSSKEFLLKEAQTLWTNVNELNKCIENQTYTQKVQDQMATWTEIFQITGTPGNVLINNETGEYRILYWAYPAESFIEIINSLLQ